MTAGREQDASIRKDIVQDLFADAAWLCSEYSRAFASPDLTLLDLAEDLEQRLWLHLDALSLGGEPVVNAVLLPALEEEEAETVFCAAWGLLARDAPGYRERLAEILRDGEAPPAQHQGIARALGLSRLPGLAEWISQLLGQAPAVTQAYLLDALVLQRFEPQVRLDELARAPAPELQAAALRAARHFPGRIDPSTVEFALGSPEHEVRAESLRTGLVMGLRSAWHACGKQVQTGAPGWADAAELLAIGSDEAGLEPLLKALHQPGRARAAAWALGFSGHLAAADALVRAMETEAIAPIALDAFCAITGLKPTGRFVKQEPSREADATLDEALPAPDVAEVSHWWETVQPSLPRDTRLLYGQPFSAASLLNQLVHGPMHRRPVLALEAAIRTRNPQVAALGGWASEQLRESRALSTQLLKDEPLPFPVLFQKVPLRAPKQRSQPPAARFTPVRRPRGAHASQESLAITGLGMVSSMGDGVIGSCLAAAAGFSAPTELEGYQAWDSDDCELAPISGGSVPTANGFSGMARLAALGASALADLAYQTQLEAGPRTGLFLSLPSGYFSREAELREWADRSSSPEPPEGPTNAEQLRARCQKRLVPALARDAGVPGQWEQHELFFADAPGFVLALKAAQSALQARKLDRCIVGGIDSYVEAELLEALDALRVLKTRDRAVGLIPGEGAAFILVERMADAVKRKAPVLATLGPLAFAREPHGSLSTEPKTGGALSKVLAEAMAARLAGEHGFGLVISDLNGTVPRAQDWGTALMRVPPPGLGDASVWIPAASFGELGAATGPASVCLAVRGFARGYAPSAHALVWLWGDAGDRGAFSLHAPEEV